MLCVLIRIASHHYQYKKKITLNYPKYSVCSYGMFFLGLKNEFEIAMVNEPSVFEPLKFYCIYILCVFI